MTRILCGICGGFIREENDGIDTNEPIGYDGCEEPLSAEEWYKRR
ncbi:hypothetical protein BMS3Abin17_01232 [archaeon BMS3Abin17]|nr:hypothetical protein BMS3Abin17_01232 [archaeon BMS3Abin17]